MLSYSARLRGRDHGGLTIRDRIRFALALTLGALLATTPPVGASELILNTQDFAPFRYMENGVVSGPAVDVIHRVCSDMKIECPMRLLPWRRAQQKVEEGKAHGMNDREYGDNFRRDP